jgi:polysaccharide pyruvyl transferase WcaK-like protein
MGEVASGRKRFLLHLHGGEDDLPLRKRIAEWFVRVAANDDSVELVAISDEGVDENHDFLGWFRNLPKGNIRIEPFRRPAHVLAEISQCYAIVTTKLHVGICGAVFGKRILSIPRHSKTGRLYRQLGRADVCIEGRGENSPDLEACLSGLMDGTSDPVIVPEEIKAQSNRIWVRMEAFLNKIRTGS